ncbi:helix-turn-helix domain-containing protein [Streptomyces sp. NPDC058045]|uniref:helix-turn-helix domain-containing protein n=1 Tax=Streptomyces sp. NPDC058045 TaxID=3346311 RepID=UPI0036E0176F
MRSDEATIRHRFGARVSEAARSAGYDIDGRGGKAQLARDAGMSESSVGRVLAGKVIPDPKYFEPLARVIKIDPVELFIEAELLSPNSVAAVWSSDRSTRILVARIGEMTQRDREEFAEIAEIYARRRRQSRNEQPSD